MNQKKKSAAVILAVVHGIAMACADSDVVPATQIIQAPLKFICGFDTVIRNIVGPLAVLMMVVLGAKYLAAQEDENERSQAKERLQHVLIGLVIIIIGRALVGFILTPPNCP